MKQLEKDQLQLFICSCFALQPGSDKVKGIMNFGMSYMCVCACVYPVEQNLKRNCFRP